MNIDILTDKISGLASAVRQKSSTDETMSLYDMAELIGNFGGGKCYYGNFTYLSSRTEAKNITITFDKPLNVGKSIVAVIGNNNSFSTTKGSTVVINNGSVATHNFVGSNPVTFGDVSVSSTSLSVNFTYEGYTSTKGCRIYIIACNL